MSKKENKFKGDSVEDLKKKLLGFQDDLHKIAFKAQGSKSKNVKEASSIKKNIARVLTEINKDNKKSNKNK